MTPGQQPVALTYRAVSGELVRAEAIIGAACPAPAPLRARQITLDDGTVLWQLLPGDGDRALGYERLDNEILAGLRLASLVSRGDRPVPYPPQVSRLHGYEADSDQPFALLLPYRGEPLAAMGRLLLPDEQQSFQLSLLEGLRWLAAAGIVHRGITPGTVRWDPRTRQVQITGFSLSAVLGVSRTVAGRPQWAGPEQRPGKVSGLVSDRDDLWGAGQLICYVLTGEEVTGADKLAAVPDPAGLLSDLFTLADRRPTALDLLTRLRADDPVPRELAADPLAEGRARFHALRQAKHQRSRPAGQEHRPASATPAESGRRRRRWPVAMAVGGLVLVIALAGLMVGVLR